MNVYLGTALVFLAYLVVAWLVGSFLHLQGSDLWILRGALALIGLTGSVIFLWFHSKQKPAGPIAGASATPMDSEIAAVIGEAEARLRSSNLGRNAKLRKLPIVFLIGDSGTAKTSTMVHSGFEPELIGGQVYEDKNIVPTRSANLWYAKNTVFIEPNSKAAETGVWTRLLRRIQPGVIHSLKAGHAPRAAVVCLPCDAFFQGAPSDALAATVRRIRGWLEEIARTLGINFPVYVLFTKADRISFFAEFTKNLTKEEAAQALGVTLPIRSVQEIGVFAEQETQRLNVAFNNLILSLADKRRDLLAREHDSQKLAGIYEFPRELRKIRSTVIQLLVDLCRPSQLRATPFLRGFYFSGVRAVVVNEIARPAVELQPARSPEFNPDANATRMFNAGQRSVASIPQPQIVSARKVPQWTFLTRFFSDVLLQDHRAMASTGGSVRTNTLRRVLLFAGSALCLLLSLALIISYAGNSALQAELRAAAREIPSGQSGFPSTSSLMQLETLRHSVEKLSQYRRDGAPLHLRWGLYVGEDLYPHARSLYFSRFHELLFGSTHAALLEFLKRLPTVPGPGDDYGILYDSLKAYLITTSNYEKSTQMFLSPVLLKRWMGDRNVDADTVALAKRQFDFYSEELKAGNPFSSENDSLAVERARRYLSQFAGMERVYQFMLAEASRKTQGMAFNSQFLGSAEVLVDTKEIPGSFSKTGWTLMQDAIKNADRFFSGEQWVLGEQASSGIDRGKLEQDLRDRYTGDFLAQWQQFLQAATVGRYGNLKDAASKLSKLSSNQSPLLALLCVVSQNTAVDSPQIKAAFQPVQFVVPSTCTERYITEANTGYMNSLVALHAVIEQMANVSGSVEALTDQAMASARQGKIVVRQVAQNFRIDPQGHMESIVQKLMEDPITYVELILRNMGPAELNAKGKGLCTQFGELAGKYPFNPNAAREATLQEVNAVFQPQQGALWTFYDANLKSLLNRQGSRFAAKTEATISINPAFVNFWNNAVAFTDAVYPDNSPQPRLAYTLRSYRPEGVENVALTIDGQTVTAVPRAFVWSGNPNSEVKLTGGTGLAYTGLWAVFKFFVDADRWTKSEMCYTIEWNLRLGRATPLTLQFELDMGKAAPVFQKNFLSNLRCVAEIVR